MLNTDKELKLYYSIAEVADMFGVNASLLRFWEKEFRRFLQDNGEGDTSVSKGGCGNDWSDLSSGEGERSDASGARQRLKDNEEATVRNYEIVNRLKGIKEELLAIKKELDGR